VITQDKKGFMWFGTRNGLNRFDGNTFKVFKSKLSDSSSIGSNSILSLYEDEKESLWVGTYKGIYIYDAREEKFTPFKLIPAAEVRYVQGDKKHNIWIISNQILYQYNLNTGKLRQHNFKNNPSIALHISEKGTIWVATVNGFVKKFNSIRNTFDTYDIVGLFKKDLTLINAIHSIGDTSLILGTIKHALLLNTKSLRIDNLFEKNSSIKTVHVHTILKESDSNFWLGTEAGLIITNSKTLKTTVVSKEISNPYSINDNIISSIYKDIEGGIWIATYFGGINYYSKHFNNFRKYFPEPGKNSISGNLVHELCKDQYGKLWIGTEDAGLNQMDPKTGHIKHFMPDNKQGSISYHNIHGLVADGDKLWIGTYEHGLDVMDLKTNKVIRHYNAGPNSFTSDFIITLYKTRQSEILVGTWNGLFKYNRNDDTFSPLPYLNGHIQTIVEDDEGTLWVGTYGGGLYYQNSKSNKKGKIEYIQGKPNSLINNYINNLYQDSKKNFWLCTEGGLSKLTPSTGKITNYTFEDGLPDNQIFRIIEDSNGSFWISTSKGLSHFNPKTLTFNNYHTSHGLPTEQFNYNSSFKNDDGTIFFGTVRGLISFKPSQFIRNNFIPPVYITGIKVNNEDVEINKKGALLKQALMYSKSLTLPYDKSNISLDVAALSYVIPEMNNYLYKMEGIDKNWIALKDYRKIFYTNLPPGDYVLKIKGSNNEGIWNQKETSLEIKITPPYWATNWAYLLYFMIVISIVSIIFWYYRLALFEKSKRKIEIIEINKEREIYNAKIEFFTNVAHEIRTPLTLIKMPLDKLISKQSDDPETNESLNMMKKNTNRLIDLTNQLLDFRKAEANKFSLNFSNTDINELLNDVFFTFKPAAEQKNLNYKLELPRIALQAFVDQEALKKIISNLINNAIKYANEKVLVKLLPFNSDDIAFNIEFRNDGHIVPDEYKEKIFEPFFRLEQSSKEAGTGIGLPLSRSLTELHKGSLELKRAGDDINVFLLSIPIHQDNEINLGDYSVTESNENITEEADDSEKNIQTSKPAILIVEDNKEILNYLQKELSINYNIKKAYNGQEALDILLNDHIQLVISDIMMPIMDGIELCKKMKNDFQFSHIPIILLTAKNSINSKIEGLEVGADAYIEKPFSFEYLLAQINNLLINRNIIKEYFARSPLSHIKGIAYSKADKDFLEKLNSIIYEHITDMDLDVDQLSSMMNMSRPTLYRKIKGLSNLTPNELINLSRLKKAAELLAEGDYKINEVANMVGYSMPTNFSRDFQKQFGVSPSSYIVGLKKDTE
jgi:ligand-binding sensor domain-containing protein/signal transduction histidine kinase/CheY-like chemotaxis protein